jgi:putative ATP-dependent endonuclease of the OLD family
MTVDSGKDSIVDDLTNVSVKIKNYMCFGESPQGLESIKPINIIIGRNNSGKSRSLDMFQFAVSQKEFENCNRNGKESEILISLPLVESELKSVFPQDTSNSLIGNYWDFGRKYIKGIITFSLHGKREILLV